MTLWVAEANSTGSSDAPPSVSKGRPRASWSKRIGRTSGRGWARSSDHREAVEPMND